MNDSGRHPAAGPREGRVPAPAAGMVAVVNPVPSEATRATRALCRTGQGTRLVVAGVIALAAVIAGWLVFNIVNGALNEVDLTVYRDGGLIVRHVGPYYDPHAYAPLYDWGGYSAVALKFTYTPFAAIAFVGASLLPWAVTSVLSVLVNVAALAAALWFTFGALGYSNPRVRLGATLLAAAATFWLQPVVRTIYLGQINLVLMAAIMWDLCQPDLTASGRRRWWKGAATGVAAGIKLVPLIFLPYLLITRRFREAVGVLCGFAATVAVGFAVLPHDSSRWWLHGLFWSDGNRTGFMGWAGNQSLRAIITRFSGSVAGGQEPWIVAAVVALAVGLTAAYLLNRAGYPVPALLATALTGLLVSPVSWDHHWVWIALMFAVTAHYALAASRRAQSVRSAQAVSAARWTARRLWALIAVMVFFFAAWPDAIWESARTLGNFSLGFLWAQANTNPVEFAQRGDQPQYVEYHWHGFQLLWGNSYIIAGVGLLLIALVTGLRLRKGPPVADAPAQEPVSAAL
jgi:alpha-1,2-mannosyltransferase